MPSVSLEVVRQIATITIARPERRNAFDRRTAVELATAFDEVDGRDDVAVAVLTGAGGTFSAGMDLKALAETGERPTSARGMLGIAERPPSKPLIAAVEGACLGGGFEIALACDLIVAAHDARLGLPEVRRGLVAAAGGLLRLPMRLPRNVAMELILTGGELPVARARELGLVARTCPPGDALEVAHELAGVVAANAPLAVRSAKEIAGAGWGVEHGFEAQRDIVERVRRSDDAAEGARAFVEKRPPSWHGR